MQIYEVIYLQFLIADPDVMELCEGIIDSYDVRPGFGLPLGNQTSQWFALFYLDGLDRLCKERLHLKYYTRYMYDIVIIHESKEYLRECLDAMWEYLMHERELMFNEKTQIFPLKNGVEYLGFRFSLTATGKVVRRLKTASKLKYKRRLRLYEQFYKEDKISLKEVTQSLAGFHGHMKHASTYGLKKKALGEFVLTKGG